ncbi:glycoside hydrolase N-terminal domain-containing protein [Streptomyces sp. NPDC002092]
MPWGLHDLQLDPRRFLTGAAMTAGAVALPGLCAGRAAAAVPPQVTLPDRGIYDTATASAWPDGFVTGNGEYGAVYYGAPTLEKVIFNHLRFVLPNGTRTMSPPVIADRLASVRDEAPAGDYSGAQTTFAPGWSLRWTQTFHPGHELQLNTPVFGDRHLTPVPRDPPVPSRTVTLLHREGAYRSAVTQAFTELAHNLVHSRGYTPPP